MASLPSLIFVVPRITTLTRKTHKRVTTHSWARRVTTPTCTPRRATATLFVSCMTFRTFAFLCEPTSFFCRFTLFTPACRRTATFLSVASLFELEHFGVSLRTFVPPHRFLNLNCSSLLSGHCCPSHRFLNLDCPPTLSGHFCPSHRFVHSCCSMGNSLRCRPCCK